MCFGTKMPKYGNSYSDPWKIEQFGFLHFVWKLRMNTLLTSPQPLSGDELKPIYVQKRVLGPKCPNMVISSPDPLKIENFEICPFDLKHLVNTLLTSPQPLSEGNF